MLFAVMASVLCEHFSYVFGFVHSWLCSSLGHSLLEEHPLPVVKHMARSSSVNGLYMRRVAFFAERGNYKVVLPGLRALLTTMFEGVLQSRVNEQANKTIVTTNRGLPLLKSSATCALGRP